MRSRRLLSLSIAALAAIALTGCSAGAATPSASDSATAEATADLCEGVAAAGDAVSAITVDGAFGELPAATFTAPLEFDAVERAVVIEGDGEVPEDGDLVTVLLTVFDSTTGELAASQGYNEDPLVPSQLLAGSVLGEVIGCEPVGSRFVFTLPASDSSPTPLVYVVDFTGITPSAAWGTPKDPVEGMPTVELAENGQPTVTIPEGEAPTEVQLETLKEGDGAVVGAGDTVLVQYTGVQWSDGAEFDSSWTTGAPISFATTGVVEGFKQALEGQTVGSQVVVVVPPAFGYGASEGHDLQDETLVFVVDILATQAAVAAE